MTRCDECGFVYEQLAAEDISAALLLVAEQIGRLLVVQDTTVLATRPETATWSALEYACHVRDVLLVQRERVLLALVEDHPSFVPMYRDDRVGLAGYSSDEPAEVAEEVVFAAGLLARLYRRLSAEQLARRCLYNYPVPTDVDLTWVGQHTVHEGEHHLGDMTHVIAALS